MTPTLRMLAALAATMAAGHVQTADARSSAEVNAFKRAHPCPTVLGLAECRTARVDHRTPLCAGGADSWRTNLQWQSLPDSRAKDREEIRLCAAIRAGRAPMPRNADHLCRLLVPAEQWPWMRRSNCVRADAGARSAG